MIRFSQFHHTFFVKVVYQRKKARIRHIIHYKYRLIMKAFQIPFRSNDKFVRIQKSLDN